VDRLSDDELAGRHPGVTELLSFFDAGHLPDDLRVVSEPCGELAHHLVATLPDGPELTTGLRKLLEAKDCAVRQAIRARISRSAPWVAPNARGVAGADIEREGDDPRDGDLDGGDDEVLDVATHGDPTATQVFRR